MHKEVDLANGCPRCQTSGKGSNVILFASQIRLTPIFKALKASLKREVLVSRFINAPEVGAVFSNISINISECHNNSVIFQAYLLNGISRLNTEKKHP